MKMIGPRVARIMVSLLVAQLVGSAPLIAQTTQTPSTQSSQPANPPRQGPRPPTHADILRGEYGRYRANNDLLFYHLDVRVDPAAKHISGKNLIRFRMLKDDNRIQLDLYDNLNIDKIVLLDQSPKSKVQRPLAHRAWWIRKRTRSLSAAVLRQNSSISATRAQSSLTFPRR